MELLPDRSKLKQLSVLDALLVEVEKRYSVAFIDKEIDLADERWRCYAWTTSTLDIRHCFNSRPSKCTK
jgi:hypothetical protein